MKWGGGPTANQEVRHVLGLERYPAEELCSKIGKLYTIVFQVSAVCKHDHLLDLYKLFQSRQVRKRSYVH